MVFRPHCGKTFAFSQSTRESATNSVRIGGRGRGSVANSVRIDGRGRRSPANSVRIDPPGRRSLANSVRIHRRGAETRHFWHPDLAEPGYPGSPPAVWTGLRDMGLSLQGSDHSWTVSASNGMGAHWAGVSRMLWDDQARRARSEQRKGSASGNTDVAARNENQLAQTRRAARARSDETRPRLAQQARHCSTVVIRDDGRDFDVYVYISPNSFFACVGPLLEP